MAQYAIRTIIALLSFALFVLVAPLLLSVLGLALGGDVWQLIRICAAVIALCYVIWGPPLFI